MIPPSPARLNIAALLLSDVLFNAEKNTATTTMPIPDFWDRCEAIVENNASLEVCTIINQIAIKHRNSSLATRTASVSRDTRAIGYQGYVAYRDGGLVGIEWHTAIIYGPETSSIYYISHIF